MIGIITIIEPELQYLKDELTIDDTEFIAGIKFFRGRLGEEEIVFVFSKNNIVNVTISTQIIIDRFAVNQIFYSGYAIPLVPFIKQGDIIIANYFAWPGNDKFKRPGIFNQKPEKKTMYEVSESLLNNLMTAKKSMIGDNSQITLGTILLSWDLKSDSPILRAINQEYGALAMDNCGPVFAYTCHSNNIRYAALEIAMNNSREINPMEIKEIISNSAKKVFNLKINTISEMAETPVAAIY